MPQVLQHATSPISGVSRAMRTNLFVLRCPRKRAQLTLVAPASPTITAAFWLCDEIAATGGHLTHCLQDFREAQTLPVVWKGHSKTQVKVKELTAWFSVDNHPLLLSLNLRPWEYLSCANSLHLVIIKLCWHYTLVVFILQKTIKLGKSSTTFTLFNSMKEHRIYVFSLSKSNDR